MSQNLANYGASKLLNIIFNAQTLPQLYVALLINDADVGFDGTILQTVEVAVTDTELGTTGYGRKAAPDWSTADSGYLANTSVLGFGIATTDWYTVQGWALVDSPTAGNLYCFADFATPQYVGAGNEFKIPAGGMTIALTGLAQGIVV